MKFGISQVIHPLSTEKLIAERNVYVLSLVKSKVEQVSESVKIERDMQAEEVCLKAIRTLKNGDSMYTAIEFFTDEAGITRMNVCHMQEVQK